MLDNQKRDFAALMDATMPIFGIEASKPTKLIWWNLLAAYEFADVSRAFAQHLKTSKFAPRPADIIEIIDTMRPDGRIGAEEAWAMIPKDEGTSAVVTDEMLRAWGVAQELYDDGDRIGARMAFKDAYTRLTEQSKLAGKKPTWTLSQGWDVKGREAVIVEAVRLGRLDASHIASVGLVPDRSNTGIAAVQEKLAGMRAAIGSGAE